MTEQEQRKAGNVNNMNGSLKKKNVQCKSCELSFFLEQNENYSLGDSISDSSEKLPQKGWGED